MLNSLFHLDFNAVNLNIESEIFVMLFRVKPIEIFSIIYCLNTKLLNTILSKIHINDILLSNIKSHFQDVLKLFC